MIKRLRKYDRVISAIVGASLVGMALRTISDQPFLDYALTLFGLLFGIVFWIQGVTMYEDRSTPRRSDR